MIKGTSVSPSKLFPLDHSVSHSKHNRVKSDDEMTTRKYIYKWTFFKKTHRHTQYSIPRNRKRMFITIEIDIVNNHFNLKY